MLLIFFIIIKKTICKPENLLKSSDKLLSHKNASFKYFQKKGINTLVRDKSGKSISCAEKYDSQHKSEMESKEVIKKQMGTGWPGE